MSNNNSGKRIIINSLIYTMNGLLIKCFSFFLLPLYTFYLTTEDYGITSLVASFISTASFIVSFSLFSAVMRFYVELKETPEKLKRFYGTMVIFVTSSSFVFGVLLSTFRTKVSGLIFSGIDYYPIIFMCLISLCFNSLYTVFDQILRSQQKALKSTIFSSILFFIIVGLNILFVVFFKMGAKGVILSSLIGYAICSLYFIIEMCLKRLIVFCIDLKLLKESLKYSIPIMPHNLSTNIALLVSKVLIGGSVSLTGVGLYSVASQFGNMADTIQGYVDSAYGPWLYEKLHNKENDYKQSIRDISKLLISVIGLFFLGIALFSQDYILLFLDESYFESWKYIPLIVIIFTIKTIYYFYVEVMFFYKKASNKLFIATFSGSLINILLSYLIIPILGIYGSILADAIAMLVRVSIIVYISKKYDNIGLRISDFIINAIIVSVFICLGLYLSYTKYEFIFSISNFIYKIFIVIVYLIFSSLINKKQLMPILNKLKK